MKCPNCGSTAQVRIDDHETCVWRNTVTIYLNYKCGCGCRFSSRLEANRSEEKLLWRNRKKG